MKTIHGLGLGLCASALLAQPPVHVRHQQNMVWVNGEPVAGGAGPAGAGTFEFIAAEPLAAAKRNVKGAPYSAEGVTETVQTLADGTRITRRSTKKVARDGEGRTREEMSLPAIGPWASAGDAPRLVTIHDPVAGETYLLNEKEKSARKIKAGAAAFAAGTHAGMTKVVTRKAAAAQEKGAVKVEQDVLVIAGSDNPGPAPVVHAMPTFNVEVARKAAPGQESSLGEQILEGVRVTGTRFTHTIPEGEIGNDRPLETVIERWTSPELQVLVRSHTKDPQAGETNYRLTNLERGEPDKSLFQIPADYTIQEGPGAPFFIEHKVTR